MLDANTAWAIALLLAPTGVAAAGTGLAAPAGHTAYVELTITEDRGEGLASIEARVACSAQDQLQRALDWLADEDGCTAPPGAAVYVTNAKAPSPGEAAMVPTGTVYAYEDADRVWTVRAYTYGSANATHHAYVLAPDLSDRVSDEGQGEPVRGVVDLDRLGIGPGERGRLTTTLAAAPATSPTDPTVERVDAENVASLGSASTRGFTG